MSPFDKVRARFETAIRVALEAPMLGAIWEQAKTMSLEQAIAFALDDEAGNKDRVQALFTSTIDRASLLLSPELLLVTGKPRGCRCGVQRLSYPSICHPAYFIAFSRSPSAQRTSADAWHRPRPCCRSADSQATAAPATPCSRTSRRGAPGGHYGTG